ncbi:MAG TPA: amidase [archaeon]|nr:amidase [archaeon]
MAETLNRRKFLGLAAGIAVLSCGKSEKPGQLVLDKGSGVRQFEFDEATISGLQEGMRSGKFTSKYITEKYLERIEEIDRRGPLLKSVIEINPDALRIAESLDRERRTGNLRGPLHGIPVLIKDNIGTADRMTTTAGSLALAGSIPPDDSYAAAKLRQAGAVILGKTNLSEWANFRSSQSTSGWSGRGGQTHNPYALDRDPSGSSSGSGVAVAANLCSVAIGTETDGSIIGPSCVNCVVGIKPTVGLVGRSGIIPISHTQDTAGPMARTVRDAAVLLGALTGIDPRDTVTKESAGKSFSDYTQFLDPKGLQGARIGVARKYFGSSEMADRIVDNLIEEMKSQGAIIIDPVEIPRKGKIEEFMVMLYEFKADLNSYLQELGPPAPVHSLAEIIEFNERNREKEMPYFGQDIFIKAEEKGPLSSPEYQEALSNNLRLSREEGIDALMEEHTLDAVMAPSGGPPSLTDLVNGDHYVGGSSGPAAVAGYPIINVPAGFIFGLPFGVSFFGRAYSEPALIKLAYAFEQATNIRRPPQFLKTADLSL